LIQERDAKNNVLVTYLRGLDMSGSLSGAGGIGGLLARTDTNGSTFYHADGSGNITALIDSSENIVARYAYGPFGKPIGKWGTMADPNEMRFSSMPYYSSPQMYGYLGRFYDPNLQRWLNQDPIGEPGGINLYGFLGNDPIDNLDPDGLSPDSWPFIGPFISNMELNDFARRFSDKDANQFQDYNDAMRYFNPNNGNNWTAGDQSAVQAAAEAAKGGAEGYLAVATAVTPGGAEERGLGALPSKVTKCEAKAASAAEAGAMAGRRLGHTFTKHGMDNTMQLLREAAGSGKPVGQWLDNAAAEQFIADHLDELNNGAKTFDLPEGLGRVVNPDGTFSPATKATLVPSGSGVKTAFPIN
jgi:RHS repeat-associated protein